MATASARRGAQHSPFKLEVVSYGWVGHSRTREAKVTVGRAYIKQGQQFYYRLCHTGGCIALNLRVIELNKDNNSISDCAMQWNLLFQDG